MKKAVLVRTSSGDEGTFGHLCTGGGMYTTAELPWRGNKTDISCIPTGVYKVTKRKPTAKFSYDHWLVEDVRHRTDVLIHIGNYAGDVSKGFKSDVKGCIVVGTQHGVLSNQGAVLCSKDALSKFNNEMPDTFELTIISVWEANEN